MRDGQLQLSQSVHDANQITAAFAPFVGEGSGQQVESAVTDRDENHSAAASAAAPLPPLATPPPRRRSISDPSQCARCMHSASAYAHSTAQQPTLPPLECALLEPQDDSQPAAADSSIAPPAKRARRKKPAATPPSQPSQPRTLVVVEITGIEWRHPTQQVSLRLRLAALHAPGSPARQSFIPVRDLTQAIFHPVGSGGTITAFLKQYGSCKQTTDKSGASRTALPHMLAHHQRVLLLAIVQCCQLALSPRSAMSSVTATTSSSLANQ